MLRDFFTYKKPDTSEKGRQFALCFYIQNSGHCALRDFHEVFEIVRGRGTFLYPKTMHFALNFYKQKAMDFTLPFYIQKASHFALHFYMQKQVYFALRFYI